ncbi:hypothetical protein DFH06DRAFT_702736 [Mycena polygramma]|nr:hypothetical protein DFH06DRAFT_702736 [Mycena polygramma]
MLSTLTADAHKAGGMIIAQVPGPDIPRARTSQYRCILCIPPFARTMGIHGDAPQGTLVGDTYLSCASSAAIHGFTDEVEQLLKRARMRTRCPRTAKPRRAPAHHSLQDLPEQEAEEQEAEGDAISGDMFALASGDEERDLTEIAESKELVDHWLLCIREVETFEPAVCEP